MDFYKIVKYVLMVLLLAIIAVGVFNSSDTNSQQTTLQPVIQQQPQSKFNF